MFHNRNRKCRPGTLSVKPHPAGFCQSEGCNWNWGTPVSKRESIVLMSDTSSRDPQHSTGRFSRRPTLPHSLTDALSRCCGKPTSLSPACACCPATIALKGGNGSVQNVSFGFKCPNDLCCIHESPLIFERWNCNSMHPHVGVSFGKRFRRLLGCEAAPVSLHDMINCDQLPRGAGRPYERRR